MCVRVAAGSQKWLPAVVMVPAAELCVHVRAATLLSSKSAVSVPASLMAFRPCLTDHGMITTLSNIHNFIILSYETDSNYQYIATKHGQTTN